MRELPNSSAVSNLVKPKELDASRKRPRLMRADNEPESAAQKRRYHKAGCSQDRGFGLRLLDSLRGLEKALNVEVGLEKQLRIPA